MLVMFKELDEKPMILNKQNDNFQKLKHQKSEEFLLAWEIQVSSFWEGYLNYLFLFTENACLW